jgi:hypothetical protein
LEQAQKSGWVKPGYMIPCTDSKQMPASVIVDMPKFLNYTFSCHLNKDIVPSDNVTNIMISCATIESVNLENVTGIIVLLQESENL